MEAEDKGVVFEFRCDKHIVRMRLTGCGAYAITVTHTGSTIFGGNPYPDQTYEVAQVVDKDLAVHCFNHTVQQYQKEAL